MQIEAPDEVAVTLNVTMPLKSWRALNKQLGAPEIYSPGWDLCKAIRGAIEQVEQKIFQLSEP